MQEQSKQRIHSYNEVIHQAISAAIQQGRGSIAGFCMLQGPTGSGKTSALYHQKDDGTPAVLEFLRQQQQGRLRAIVVTHRWNILQDIYQKTTHSCDSIGQPFRASILYGQIETFSAAVQQKPLSHETLTPHSTFPSFQAAIEQFDAWQLFATAKEKSLLAKHCRAVRDLARSVERRERFTPAHVLQYEQDELSKLCGQIESALLKMMAGLANELAHLKDIEADASVLEVAQKKLADFRAQPWVRRVFPAIAWRDEQQDLLIMTTQKLLLSFYDGQSKVRLSSPELAGYVIFIDEFDYQADVFQGLLAQAQKVQELPICIALLLEKGQELCERLQHDARPDVQGICTVLGELLTDLKSDLAEKHIDLSAVNNFVMPLQDFKAGKSFQTQYLFRADHLATREPLFLRKTSQGFAVMQGESRCKKDIDVGTFLRLMEGYLRRYTTMLSHPVWTDSTAFEYLRQLNAVLFDATNDYRTSYYSRVLPQMAYFTLPVAHVPELKPLLASNILPHTQAHLHGFTTWLLKASEDAYAMDQQRLQVKRAFMPTTAEGLLVALASRNLVFGLSATAYIERALGHFDVRWINAALRYITQVRDPQCGVSFLGDSLHERQAEWLDKPMPYLPDARDLQQQQRMIERLTQDKAKKRATHLQVREVSFFAEPTPEYQELLRALPSDFFSTGADYEAASALQHRQKLLVALLRVLHITASRTEHQGHLIFVNSSRHLRELFKQQQSLMAEYVPWFAQDVSFYSDLDQEHPLIGFEQVFVPAQLLQRPVLVCFLNAEHQKKPGFAQAYQAAFATGRTVIVVAQAASATNGINLDFTLPDSGSNSDLTCLYLLESQHFYFSPAQHDGATDPMTHAGMQLRDLDKLRRFSQISRVQHRQYLSPLMAQESFVTSSLNTLYKHTEDRCKNLAADVQQQIGRIERAWSAVPQVEIYLEPQIAESLRTFSKLPVYQNNQALVSELNQRLLAELNQTVDSAWLQLLSTPAQRGDAVEQWIDRTLVASFPQARTDKNIFIKIEPLWRNLGRAVLQYDLQWQFKSTYLPSQPLKDWACVERPAGQVSSAKLWYNPSTWQFFVNQQPGCKVFDVEQLYRPVQHCPAILEWFRHKDYRTSLTPFANETEERHVLHPLIVQRILQGRLGEEGVRALLEDAGVATTAQYVDHRVFEVYDFAIPNSVFRVDAKYWSGNTLSYADSLFMADGSERSPLAGFISTLNTLRAVEGAQKRLLILNLVTPRAGHTLMGFTASGEHIAAQQADIIVLEGCVNSRNWAVTEGFKQLVSLINKVGHHE